ncbi:MAG: GNAT family N-acetyltransferase [Thermoplasmata archaeon]
MDVFYFEGDVLTEKAMPIEVRKARREDLGRINDLTDAMHKYMAGLYGLELSTHELEEEHYDEDELEDVYVAVDAERGVVIGYMSFSHGRDEWAGPHYALGHMVVDEDYGSLGIGRELFSVLAQRAREECVNITTGTLKRNKRAMEFYESLGFKPLSVRLLLDIQERLFKD